MKLLTHIYYQALVKDNRNTTNQACAYMLQRALYENTKDFGKLYKYDNFCKAFNATPTMSECVTFISFWKGVEDALVDKDDIMDECGSLDLSKDCFVDDDYVKSMRTFRDELLKNKSYITRSNLIDSIIVSKDVCNLGDFWSQVLENTEKTFTEDLVSLSDISNMVFVFFSKKCNIGKVSTVDIGRASTCATLGERESQVVNEGGYIKDDSDVDLYSFRPEDLSIYEFKYRKLLLELEQTLPKFYFEYTNTKSKLMETNEKLHEVLGLNDKLTDDFTNERLALLNDFNNIKMAYNYTLTRNNELADSLKCKDTELKGYKQQLDEVKNTYNISDSSKLEQELQMFMAKCDGLQKSNQNLKSVVNDLESRLNSISRMETVEASVQVELPIEVNKQELHSLKKLNKELEFTLNQINFEREDLVKENDLLKKKNQEFEVKLYRIDTEYSKLLADLEEKERAEVSVHSSDEYNKLLSKYNNVLQEHDELLNKYNSILKEYNDVVPEREKLEIELCDSRRENEIAKEELEVLRREFKALSTERDNLLTAQSDSNILESHLRERMESVLQENIRLVSKLELMKMPNSNVRSKMMELIDNYKDLEPTLSCESESSFDDRNVLNNTNNTIKLNPALAETRRLNTANSLKFGQIQDNKEDGKVIHRTPNLFRLKSITYNNGSDVDNLSIVSCSDLGDITETDGSDIFQNAISYISQSFNSQKDITA